MKNYKLEVIMAFRDKYTHEKYKPGQVIEVEEERALELFSSQHHLVQYVSHEEDTKELDKIISENETLKNENQELKTNVDTITAEKNALQNTVDNLTTELETLKNENQEKNKDQNKEQNNKK